MLQTIINAFQAIGDMISGFFHISYQFFTIVQKLLNFFHQGNFAQLANLLPTSLSLVIAVSAVVLCVRTILGAGNGS